MPRSSSSSNGSGATPRACLECDCGRGSADPAFLSRLGRDWAGLRKCRRCKVSLFLREGFEVDKYCYSSAWIGRRRKYLGLSGDGQSVEFWPKHWGPGRPSRATKVPLERIAGIVFGAYTSTFKRLRSSDMPPNWAAFSLVCLGRTYDFSARLPDAVECYVIGFQELIWQKQHHNPEHVVPRWWAAAQGSPPAAPSAPWPTGLFLWMRLRLRLQEAAHKAHLHPHHQLWIVLVKCAMRSSDAHTKHRLFDMATKLQRIFRIDPASATADMRAIAMTLNFQKVREQELIEDCYECNTLAYLPQAPSAIAGGPMRKHGSFLLNELTESTPASFH